MTNAHGFALIALALVFGGAGWLKTFGYDLARERMPWVRAVPRALVTFIGVAELCGSVGLVLPAATGVAPYLTPLAGAGLAIAMLLAAAFHARRGELASVPLNVALFCATAFVSYASW